MGRKAGRCRWMKAEVESQGMVGLWLGKCDIHTTHNKESTGGQSDGVEELVFGICGRGIGAMQMEEAGKDERLTRQLDGMWLGKFDKSDIRHGTMTTHSRGYSSSAK